MLGTAETLLRLSVAALAGSVIGYERERLQWAAGLRTHMLVCVGSCLVVIVSAYGFSDVLSPHVVLDPSRIAAQVVSGIGFLGAGTILLRGEVVKGLTTAASLWAVAAIGLAVGSGLYVAGIATTAIVVGILAGLKPIEDRVRERSRSRRITIVAERDSMTLAVLHEAIGPRASRVKQFVLERGGEGEPDSIEVTFTKLPSETVERIAGHLRSLPHVVSVEAEG
jgi:putative Mg2+ transporter-C (MgtC) family protein